MNRQLAVLLFLLSGFCWADNTKAEAATTLDFIYVNANTGEAAGGHTAIRLGSTVFHFQFFPQDRFLLVRESWSHFRYVYNELRNRSIFIARIPVAPPVYAQLRNHFTGLLMAQQQDLNHWQDSDNQRDFLAQLVASAERLEIESVGLFDSTSGDDAGMRRLRQIIQHQLGEDYLAQQHQQVETQLTELAAKPEIHSDGISWAAKLHGLLLEREFLQFMEKGTSLAEESVLGLSVDAPKLLPEQQQVLKRFREKLAASIVNLLQSQRPDRSSSLMLQTARYLVVDRALAAGILLTLDPFSSRANLVAVEQKNDLWGLQAQLQQDAMQAQQQFFLETTHPDIAYAILESSMGRLHEIVGALHDGHSVRVEPGILLPARRGWVSTTELALSPAELPLVVAENEKKLAQLKQAIENRYSYDLVTQNCATELLRSLNTAFQDQTAGQRALGGWLTPDDGLVFIPNQFFTLIKKHFPIQSSAYFPSRRLRQLDKFYASENALQVWLRESNTLSSTVYTPRSEDTPFLFFTDDTLLLRPIQGLANLLWGAANSVGGALFLPVDGGERFHQGLRGMFYSLPELAFGNIRKGTYGYAETTTVGP